MGHGVGPIDFVTTAYVVHDNKVLLVLHRKLQRWLAPGGHIKRAETPDACAIREVQEETGLRVRLLATDETRCDYFDDGVWVLTQPLAVQLEDIQPGHQHVDLVYVAEADSAVLSVNYDEALAANWFDESSLDDTTIPASVRYFAKKALDIIRRRSHSG